MINRLGISTALLLCAFAPFAQAQENYTVAPPSTTTYYPPNYYIYSLPRESSPFDVKAARSSKERRRYEAWNAWLSNPYRPAYLMGQQEAIRLGLQDRVYSFVPVKPPEDPVVAEKEKKFTPTGGIGKIGGNIGKVGKTDAVETKEKKETR